MVTFNDAYMAPFGMIKGPEFLSSLLSWVLSAAVLSAIDGYRETRKRREKKDTCCLFLLISGVLTWVFVIVWFSINVLSTRIKLRYAAYTMLGVFHFVLGGAVIAAGCWVVTERNFCQRDDWDQLMYCSDNIGMTVSGICGIITGIILIFDALVHFYERNRGASIEELHPIATSTTTNTVLE